MLSYGYGQNRHVGVAPGTSTLYMPYATASDLKGGNLAGDNLGIIFEKNWWWTGRTGYGIVPNTHRGYGLGDAGTPAVAPAAAVVPFDLSAVGNALAMMPTMTYGQAQILGKYMGQAQNFLASVGRSVPTSSHLLTLLGNLMPSSQFPPSEVVSLQTDAMSVFSAYSAVAPDQGMGLFTQMAGEMGMPAPMSTTNWLLLGGLAAGGFVLGYLVGR